MRTSTVEHVPQFLNSQLGLLGIICREAMAEGDEHLGGEADVDDGVNGRAPPEAPMRPPARTCASDGDLRRAFSAALLPSPQMQRAYTSATNHTPRAAAVRLGSCEVWITARGCGAVCAAHQWPRDPAS